MKKSLLGICILAALGFVSCNHRMNTPSDKYADMRNTFDFATAKEVVVNVTYPLQFRAKVEVYTQCPIFVDDFKNYAKDPSAEPIAVGYTDQSGKLSISLRMADMVDEIFVYSPTASMPVLLSGKLSVDAKEITLTQDNSIEPSTKVGTRVRDLPDNKKYWTEWSEQQFDFRTNPDWSWKTNGKPEYLLDKGLDVTDKMLAVIDATIPKGENLDLRYAGLDDIAISEEANVKMYFISNSSARKNTLAYYTYTDTKPTKEQINKTATVVFPNLSKEGLRSGDGVELQYFDGTKWSRTFPKGAKIGFVLLIDGWNDKSVLNNSLAMYSERLHNRYDIPSLSVQMASRPQMAVFKADDKFILTFEDLPWNESPKSPYPGDFADDIFVLEANPESALPPVDGGQDPEEPSYGIELKSNGILAFEDLWPHKGDYDMNDVVVKYNSSYFVSTDYTHVTAVMDEYTLIHNGAQRTNGCGLEFGFAASDIKSIEMSTTNGVAAPVMDQNQLLTKATLMLFESANAVPKGTVFSVKMVFKNEGLPTYSFKRAPYNPFITVNAVNGENLRGEVHLVNFTPTPRANTTQFGKADDMSNPAKGIYYASDAAYPFAIDIVGAEHYDVPGETQAIDMVYPNFSKWVESNGKEYKDWYKK